MLTIHKVFCKKNDTLLPPCGYINVLQLKKVTFLHLWLTY